MTFVEKLKGVSSNIVIKENPKRVYVDVSMVVLLAILKTVPGEFDIKSKKGSLRKRICRKRKKKYNAP